MAGIFGLHDMLFLGWEITREFFEDHLVRGPSCKAFSLLLDIA
jgi:hypothetical protein